MDMSKFEAKRVFDTPRPREGQIFWTESTIQLNSSALHAVDQTYQFHNDDVEEVLEKFKALKEYGASFALEGYPEDITFTLKDQQTLVIRLQGENSEVRCHPAEFLSITENRIKENRR